MGSDMMWRSWDYEAAMTKLYAENKAQKETIESLRAAVRAADAVFAAQDHPVFAKGEEKALADWREARAKCGGVT